MTIISTTELAELLAGGDSYIRTKNGEVKGLAVTTDKNPDAPEIIVVGKGPRIVGNAKLFIKSKNFVPVYVKQAVNEWKYLGEYKALKYSTDLADIERHRKHRAIDGIDGILFLESSDDIEVTVNSKRTIPDTETKKKIELSAIKVVCNYYSEYNITDRQKDNCGYDLYIEKNGQVLKVEVKGTSSVQQRFFLSRNESAKSADPLWRLAIVTESLSTPSLEIFTEKEMREKFNFDALCWECTESKI